MNINLRSKIACVITLLYTGTINAADNTAISAYLMLASEKPNSKTFLWTEPVNAQVSETTQNWNRPITETWGVGNRYPSSSSPAALYSDTDPGFTGPNGEHYGIEIEFGDTTIPPRSPGTKNVRFYTDFGQTGATTSGVDRAEVHIRSTLQALKVQEGDTLWFGWSEYYSHLDKTRVSTVLQFRNQPNTKSLTYNGFSDEEINDLIEQNVHISGPACAIETKPVNGSLHYHFAARTGKPSDWQVPTTRKHTTDFPIETGKWYDFIVQMKYSQSSNGRYRVWIYQPDTDSNYSASDAPEWDHTGSTMYTYPSSYMNEIPSPELRFGVYRYNAVNANDISESNRYMIKYAGPMRLWVGDGEEGFNHVKPR